MCTIYNDTVVIEDVRGKDMKLRLGADPRFGHYSYSQVIVGNGWQGKSLELNRDQLAQLRDTATAILAAQNVVQAWSAGTPISAEEVAAFSGNEELRTRVESWTGRSLDDLLGASDEELVSASA